MSKTDDDLRILCPKLYEMAHVVGGVYLKEWNHLITFADLDHNRLVALEPISKRYFAIEDIVRQGNTSPSEGVSPESAPTPAEPVASSVDPLPSKPVKAKQKKVVSDKPAIAVATKTTKPKKPVDAESKKLRITLAFRLLKAFAKGPEEYAHEKAFALVEGVSAGSIVSLFSLAKRRGEFTQIMTRDLEGSAEMDMFTHLADIYSRISEREGKGIVTAMRLSDERDSARRRNANRAACMVAGSRVKHIKKT